MGAAENPELLFKSLKNISYSCQSLFTSNAWLKYDHGGIFKPLRVT
jgi:hypothetical protein